MNNSTTAPKSMCALAAVNINPSSGYYFAASVLVGCVIMLENLLVFVVVAKTKSLRKPAYLYMASLALADFLAGLQIAIVFRKKSSSNDGSDMELVQGMFLVSVGVSVITLLLMSIDRYHKIVHPFHYRVNMNNRIVAGAIVISWVYAGVISFLPMMGWNDSKDCSPVYPGLTSSYVFFASLHVMVVLVVTLVLYVLIFVKVRQSSMKFQKGARSSEERTHWKVAKTLAIVSAAFAACYTPLMIMGVLDVAHSIRYTKILPFFSLLAVVNSGFNPVIYGFRDTDLRRVLRAMLCLCLHQPGNHRQGKASTKASSTREGGTTCLTSCVSTRDERDAPYERRKGGEDGKVNLEVSASNAGENSDNSVASAKSEKALLPSDEQNVKL